MMGDYITVKRVKTEKKTVGPYFLGAAVKEQNYPILVKPTDSLNKSVLTYLKEILLR